MAQEFADLSETYSFLVMQEAGYKVPDGMKAEVANTGPPTNAPHELGPVEITGPGFGIDKYIFPCSGLKETFEGVMEDLVHRKDVGGPGTVPALSGPEADGVLLEINIFPAEAQNLIHPGQGMVEDQEKGAIRPGDQEDLGHFFDGWDLFGLTGQG